MPDQNNEENKLVRSEQFEKCDDTEKCNMRSTSPILIHRRPNKSKFSVYNVVNITNDEIPNDELDVTQAGSLTIHTEIECSSKTPCLLKSNNNERTLKDAHPVKNQSKSLNHSNESNKINLDECLNVNGSLNGDLKPSMESECDEKSSNDDVEINKLSFVDNCNNYHKSKLELKKDLKTDSEGEYLLQRNSSTSGDLGKVSSSSNAIERSGGGTTLRKDANIRNKSIDDLQIDNSRVKDCNDRLSSTLQKRDNISNKSISLTADTVKNNSASTVLNPLNVHSLSINNDCCDYEVYYRKRKLKVRSVHLAESDVAGNSAEVNVIISCSDRNVNLNKNGNKKLRDSIFARNSLSSKLCHSQMNNENFNGENNLWPSDISDIQLNAALDTIENVDDSGVSTTDHYDQFKAEDSHKNIYSSCEERIKRVATDSSKYIKIYEAEKSDACVKRITKNNAENKPDGIDLFTDEDDELFSDTSLLLDEQQAVRETNGRKLDAVKRKIVDVTNNDNKIPKKSDNAMNIQNQRLAGKNENSSANSYWLDLGGFKTGNGRTLPVSENLTSKVQKWCEIFENL